MHSWKDMLDLLEGVGMPETLGFQADLAHTYLYLMGYNAPEHALLQDGHSEEEFYTAYEEMTDKLRPWIIIDFHVAQNDGEVHGAGSHDKTGKHCPADDPNGKLDISRCSQYWLKDFQRAWHQAHLLDGCMFPNATLENPDTWRCDPQGNDRRGFRLIDSSSLCQERGFRRYDLFCMVFLITHVSEKKLRRILAVFPHLRH